MLAEKQVLVRRETLQAFRRALRVAELIAECRREVDALLDAINGCYVEPGASGALTRGKIEILPTGRNFYAVDPRAIPTPAAWKVGVEAAEKLLEHYLRSHGRYPERLGFVLWSIDAYKADGEEIAEILYLLGVKPRWSQSGAIVGLDVIPLEELGRPRIDVVVRISGIVRDTLPNYVYMIDEAVEKVAKLDEPPEMNYVRKHYLETVERLKKLGVGDAEDKALYRVFCAPPGAYGAGVNLAVEASAWRSDEDLAKVWIQWSGYAYGRRGYGVAAHEALIEALRTVDGVVRNHPSDEHDVLGCCCYFAYHGGFYNAAKEVSGRHVEALQVDTRDASMLRIVSMREELERVSRAKLLNPRWIEEMKKHGYRGASEFARKILHLYGWQATTKMVPDWVFDEIAEKYVLDPEMRRWFEEHNPWALEEIARRLIEAARRGLWKPREDLLEKLEEAYAELEGILEDDVTVEGDHQGGEIIIYTQGDVDNWSMKAGRVEELWRKLRNAA